MLMINKKNIAFPVICATVAILLAICVWSVVRENTPSIRMSMSVDMPLYSSIEELTESSDLDAVVIGTVNAIAGHEIDYGTANPSESVGQGRPIVFYSIEVEEILHGVVEKNIMIGIIDKEVITYCESVTSFKVGDKLLLFLSEQNHENAPGIKTFDHFYAPISWDNGVFDVLPGDLVQPRMPDAFASSTTNTFDEEINFNLSEVRNKIVAD